MFDCPTEPEQISNTTICLRLLETTDVHAHLLPFDYATNAKDQPYGLTRVATLIKEARAEVANTVLFDNGDFLQGTPMAELGLVGQSHWTGDNPVIRAMNGIGYDAVNLGNHEFNFGLCALEKALRQGRGPFLCANALRVMGPNRPPDIPAFTPWVLLPRVLQDSSGHLHTICIGVLGLVPPEITSWDKAMLGDSLRTRPMCDVARDLVPGMRRCGADLVVILAHTGREPADTPNGPQNCLSSLASIPGVDAIFAGHTHESYHSDPSSQAQNLAGRDPKGPAPVVMAGYRGDCLGVVDLQLERRAGRWSVTGRRTELRPVADGARPLPTPADPDLSAQLMPAHQHILRQSSKPITQSAIPIHSYLWMIGRSSAADLVAQAKRRICMRRLAQGPWSELPVVTVTSHFRWGGRAGPGAYTDIPPGELTRRNLLDLYPFPNFLCAHLIRGSDLKLLLEQNAARYGQIVPGAADADLLLPGVLGEHLDAFAGLHYRMDLSRPAIDMDDLEAPTGLSGRITDLTYQGRAVRDDEALVLCLNSYRASGDGRLSRILGDKIPFEWQLVREILAEYLASRPIQVPFLPAFDIVAPPGSAALFTTGPGVRHHLGTPETRMLSDMGQTSDGFAKIRIQF